MASPSVCGWRQTRAGLAAWGFTIEGRRVLLHMMAGSKEDEETVTEFYEDMKRRGLNDPLLVTSDGAPGIIKAIEVCFPSAARQSCLAHRMRNLAARCRRMSGRTSRSERRRPIRCRDGPLRANSRPASLRTTGANTRARSHASWTTSKPYRPQRYPVTHRRAIRTTNCLNACLSRNAVAQDHPECVRRESRLEADVRCVIRAAERWRSIKVTS